MDWKARDRASDAKQCRKWRKENEFIRSHPEVGKALMELYKDGKHRGPIFIAITRLGQAVRDRVAIERATNCLLHGYTKRTFGDLNEEACAKIYKELEKEFE